jgi:hypothetical protein
MNAHSDLALVIWDITNYVFGDNKPPSIDVKVVDTFHERLDAVTQSFPSCIRLGETPTVGVMELQ